MREAEQGAAARSKETIRISKRVVDGLACPSGKKKELFWDASVKGFGIAVTASGHRSYVLQYRMGGRGAPTRRFTIGEHGSPWTPETARQRALDLLASIRLGTDPLEEARSRSGANREDERAGELAFGAYADRFIRRHVVAGGLRSRKDIEQTFDRDLRPWFRDIRVDRITRQDVKDMLAHVGERSQSAANKAYKWLSRMFSWGVESDVLEASPMAGLKKPFRESRRQRFLQRNEIRELCGVLHRLPLQFAALYLLLLLTGQRLREVAGMRWSELDFETGDWLIPGTRTKNKLPHLVPLSRPVLAILERIAPPELRRGLVLTTNGRTPISGFSKMKARVDELVGGGIPAPWVVHDLRRTFSTMCAQLGIRTEHVEAALNHVSGTRSGVAGTYNVYQYRAEKLKAFQRWAATVERIVGRAAHDLLPCPRNQI